MKYKLMIVFVALCFLLFGCNASSNQITTDPTSTTPPATSGSENVTDPSIPEDSIPEMTFPEEFEGIQLPAIEFDDSYHEGVVVVPVTKPSVPEPDEETGEADDTDEDETIPVTAPYYPGDQLPMDEWE